MRPGAWLGVALGAFLAAGCGAGAGGGPSTAGGLTAEQHRELATRLQAAGVVGEAAESYAAYLDLGGPAYAPARANVAYQVGKMLLEAGRTEDALSWFYRVDMLDPATPLKAEVGSRVVRCLESLGRHQEAARALDARTAREEDPRRGADRTGSEVIARLGAEAVTRADVDAALDALPPALRRKVEEDHAERVAFTRDFLAQEVLYRKARKEGIDQDPAVRGQVDRVARGVVVGEMVRRRIERDLKLDEVDARNWFEVNRGRYAQAGKAPPSFEAVRDRVARDYAMEKQDRIARELFDEALAGGEVELVDRALARPAEPARAAAGGAPGGAP